MQGDDYTKEGLLAFLKQSAMAGMINPATARSRRTAAEELLSQLSEEEAQDLRRVDVDELSGRFHKLQGSSIRPETLRLYRNRLRSALTDYFAYLDDPDSFRSVGGENRHIRKRGEAERTDEQQALEQIRLTEIDRPDDLFTVPLREDCVVYIRNLPLDITAEEAAKVARVILALAEDDKAC